VRSTRQAGFLDSMIFYLAVDDDPCGFVTASQTNDWVQVLCGRVPIPEGEHEVALQISTSPSYGAMSFSVDDFVIRVVD
jgi:hypothetical protein